jgi:hypothetical protein
MTFLTKRRGILRCSRPDLQAVTNPPDPGMRYQMALCLWFLIVGCRSSPGQQIEPFVKASNLGLPLSLGSPSRMMTFQTPALIALASSLLGRGSQP